MYKCPVNKATYLETKYLKKINSFGLRVIKCKNLEIKKTRHDNQERKH
jgi:hypothetical protein